MHTSFPKGTTIHIIFKDGSTTTGKFSDHKSGRVLLEDGRTIELDKVRAMSPRRLKSAHEPNSDKKVIFRT